MTQFDNKNVIVSYNMQCEEVYIEKHCKIQDFIKIADNLINI